MIWIVTSPRNGGKTAWCREFSLKTRAAGFLSEKDDPEGTVYRARFIPEGPSMELCSRNERGFDFSEVAFDQGMVWFSKFWDRGPEVLILDEAGPLEASGKGWYSILSEAAGRNEILTGNRIFIMTCRPSLLEYWIRWWRSRGADPEIIYP